MHKTTGEVTALALANMSEALMVDDSGDADGKLVRVKVDYSTQPLSSSAIARATFGRCLGAIGKLLEAHLGSAQASPFIPNRRVRFLQTASRRSQPFLSPTTLRVRVRLSPLQA